MRNNSVSERSWSVSITRGGEDEEYMFCEIPRYGTRKKNQITNRVCPI